MSFQPNAVPSPIEWLIERHLIGTINDPELYGNTHWHTMYLGQGEVDSFAEFPPLYRQGIVIGREIEVGSYRADFGILAKAKGGTAVRLALECDGHTYHERTPEQASHDRARDRYFVSCGITPLRYTASEINADASRCAREALSIAIYQSGGGPP